MSRMNAPWSARIGLMALLLSCGALAGAEVHIVNQVGLTFDPEEVTVAPGDTVRWIWGSGTHTVTSGDNCTYDELYFDELLTSSNQQVDFVVPGGVSEIPYYCRPHCKFNMVGLITVVDPADLMHFLISADGDQAGVTTAGEGAGTATLNTATLELTWDVSFADLAGSTTAAHFHGPARPCQNAGPQVTVGTVSPIAGSTTLTAQQAADLQTGLWYLNIHTDAAPGGEIRGQVMPAPLLDPIPAPVPAGDIWVRLESVATGLTAPNWGTAAPGISQRLYVTDQDGIVWAINTSTGAKSVFLDQSSRLVPLGAFGGGTYDERGLLGIAFHPDYATNGLVYTYSSEPVDATPDFSTLPFGVDPNHQTVVLEWQVDVPTDPDAVVNPASVRELVRIDQPQFNHNGGALAFGPDGYLYIALGDGGSADDADNQLSGSGVFGHGCLGNGADTETILGSVLRIDPQGNNSANGNYGIPGDNPFVGVAGVDEIYAYGFRNPFRMSFDSLTGDLYVADVGQNAIEEVNIVASGGDYGWRWKEGSFFFAFNGHNSGYVTDVAIDVPGGLLDPIAEYDHDDGIAIVGGFAYRGAALPALEGRYVFGDFLDPLGSAGRLFYLTDTNEVAEFQYSDRDDLGAFLLGMGQGPDGELYVLTNTTAIPFESTGVVWRIIPATGDVNCDGSVDFDDISAFVSALSGEAAYNAAFPDCNWLNADCDGDGAVTFDDISCFIALLGS